jgi:hypothetical protein
MASVFRSRNTRSRYSHVVWSAYFWTSVMKMMASASRKMRSASLRLALSTLSKSGVSMSTASRMPPAGHATTSPAREPRRSWRDGSTR